MFPLCLCYVPGLSKSFLRLSWNILINECSIRVFQYKVTVLLESIDLKNYVQFHLTALFGVSIYFHGIKLHSLKYLPNMLALYWHSTPQPIICFLFYAGIYDADLDVNTYSHIKASTE